MSNLLKPILCETESESNIMNSESENNENCRQDKKIFRKNDIHIPDISEESVSIVEIISPSDDIEYHCIATRDATQCVQVCKPETIDNIIRKLDVPNTNVVNFPDDNKEYITKSKFSALIGDMRVDILSMINLLSMLNKNASASNEEIQNIKKDICNIIDENTKLKEKIANMKEDNYMCKQDIRVTRLSKNINLVHDSEQNNSEDDNKKICINSITDSHMDKNISKYKVVPSRSKRSGSDNFGMTVKQVPEDPIFSSNFRQVMRREILENKVKTIPDSKTSRANRLNLHNQNMQ